MSPGSRWLGIAAAICLGTRIASAQSSDTSLPPVALKSGQAQLFVDDYLIAAQGDLERTLRQPQKDGGGNVPLIVTPFPKTNPRNMRESSRPF